MSNELARIPQGSVIPSADEWGTIFNMARSLLPTGFLPATIKTPEQATAIILKGRELSLPPMYALSNIVVIKGKPACSAELLQALIYRDHGDDALRFTESTNEHCTIEYRRRSWKKPERYTFTIDDAKRANLLTNPTWNQYPAAMLRARCISAVARMAFADSIGGMYTPEEIGASVRVVDGVVELDESSVIDVTEHAPAMPQEAPERAIAAEVVVDDTITLDALQKLQERRAARGLTAEDLLYLAIDHTGVEQLEELTVNEGRMLYRIIDKESDADLADRVMRARANAEEEADALSISDDTATNNDSEYEEVAMFNAAHPNPMHR